MPQGLLGMDPDLSMQLGLGLLAAGGRNLAGQGNIGTALQNAMANYYGQKKAKQDLQSTDLQNQMAMQKMQMLQSAAQQYLSQSSGQSSQGPGATPAMGEPPAPTQGGMPDAAPGASPAATQAPSWPEPPTPDQIASTPIGGLNPNYDRLTAIADGKDRLTVEKQIRDQQLAAVQQQYAPALAKLETVIKSDTPTQYVKADPSLQLGWASLSKQLGYTKPEDFNDDNVRKALTFAYNGMSASVGLPTMTPANKMIQGTAADGRPTQTDPITGKVTYEAAGPNVITAEDKIRNSIEAQKLAMEKAKAAAELARVGVPAGYEPAPTPENPKAIRPIEGGPSDPTAVGGGMGNRGEVMFQRVANAGNAAAEAIKNIGELPVTSSAGWFASAHPGNGILSSVKGVLTQKMNNQDVQDYQTMLAGVSRNLATLETSGLAPGGSLTHSMDALTIGEGDTHMTKLRKMAEMRQIVDTNLNPQLSNPKVPQPQKDMIRGIIDKVDQAVPFTHHDITQFEQSKNPRATIMDFAKSSGVQPATQHPPDIQAILKQYGH